MSLFRFVQWIHEERPVTVFGDGSQSRDFTYIDDIARGTIAGLKPVGYEVINLGSDTPFVLMDALHMIENVIGKQAQLVFLPRHPVDVPASWAGIEKAAHLLDWRPRQRFEDGIKELVDWYQTHRAWAKDIVTQ